MIFFHNNEGLPPIVPRLYDVIICIWGNATSPLSVQLYRLSLARCNPSYWALRLYRSPDRPISTQYVATPFPGNTGMAQGSSPR